MLAIAGYVSSNGTRSLYLGGEFETTAGGVLRRHFIRWTNGRWANAPEVHGPVHALAVSDPQPERRLFVVGEDTRFPEGSRWFYLDTGESSSASTSADGPLFAICPPPAGDRFPVLVGAWLTALTEGC